MCDAVGARDGKLGCGRCHQCYPLENQDNLECELRVGAKSRKCLQKAQAGAAQNPVDYMLFEEDSQYHDLKRKQPSPELPILVVRINVFID